MSTAPQPTGPEFRINSHTDDDQRNSSVTALADGGFVVTWESDDDQDGDGFGVYGQRYAADGSVVGAEFQINNYAISGQYNTSVAALADGGFVVTWQSYAQDTNGLGVYGQRYAADGSVAGAGFLINAHTANHQRDPSVAALADGGFVVTWNSWGQDGSDSGVYGQRYAADGSAVGVEFQINTYTDDEQDHPSITGLADGGFVVTWTSQGQDGVNSDGVYGQRYAADGSAVGAEFLINTYTGHDQRNSSVTALADGGFVVTWQSEMQNHNVEGIYGQRYAADGSAVGEEFQINTYTTDGQRRPSVTALADGGFVVTWDSWGQDGSSGGVYGQRYAADGSAVGAEFLINTYTAGNQSVPSITGLADGGFVVTWDGWGQDGSGIGIYGQRFDAQLFGTAGDNTMSDTLGANWMNGLAGDDAMNGLAGDDTMYGGEGRDTLNGGDDDDVLNGGDGQDTLIGGDGDDTLIGGTSVDDLRDTIYGGDGNDTIDGGYGNDELRGDAGNDTIAGGFGADRVIGGTGDDVLTGSALGDEIFGGDGFDFVNGGWGHDRVNGGADGDRFFHIGIFDHGSDWIQDYVAAEGDVLVFGNTTATAADFQVNLAHTSDAEGERSGDDNVEEAFVIYRPTGQIMWALVDGGGQAEINLSIGGEVFDLLA